MEKFTLKNQTALGCLWHPQEGFTEYDLASARVIVLWSPDRRNSSPDLEDKHKASVNLIASDCFAPSHSLMRAKWDEKRLGLSSNWRFRENKSLLSAPNESGIYRLWNFMGLFKELCFQTEAAAVSMDRSQNWHWHQPMSDLCVHDFFGLLLIMSVEVGSR